jgi:hypothetical protein
MNEGHHPLPSGERGSILAGGQPALGTTPKSVVQDDPERIERFRSARRRSAVLLDTAAEWLPTERVSGCGRKPIGSAVAVHVRDGKAVVVGVPPCGCLWLCPCCGAVISWQRRKELNTLLSWARQQGHQVVMLTLTARHHRTMAFSWLLARHRAAAKRLKQSKLWRSLNESIVGHVTATETPCGKNGFHPHTHTILILDAPTEGAALDLFGGLRSIWERALEREGLDCNDHGFDVRGHAGTGDYIAKWGVAEELTFSQAKQGRDSGKGRTPWELLAIGSGLIGDTVFTPAEAKARWLEFAKAIKGRRQLVWSRGLKARAGIADIPDEEIVAAVELNPSEEVGRMTASEWWAVVRAGLRVALLERVEDQGRAGLEWILAQVRRSPRRRHAREIGT